MPHVCEPREKGIVSCGWNGQTCTYRFGAAILLPLLQCTLLQCTLLKCTLLAAGGVSSSQHQRECIPLGLLLRGGMCTHRIKESGGVTQVGASPPPPVPTLPPHSAQPRPTHGCVVWLHVALPCSQMCTVLLVLVLVLVPLPVPLQMGTPSHLRLVP